MTSWVRGVQPLGSSSSWDAVAAEDDMAPDGNTLLVVAADGNMLVVVAAGEAAVVVEHSTHHGVDTEDSLAEGDIRDDAVCTEEDSTEQELV